jgi:hypothetical protein
MTAHKITYHDVIHKAGNSVEQKWLILEGIRVKDPGFEMPGLYKDLLYLESNKLLSTSLRAASFDSPGPNVGVISKEEAVKLGREQLDTEIRGYVDIEPVARLADAFVPKDSEGDAPGLDWTPFRALAIDYRCDNGGFQLSTHNC